MSEESVRQNIENHAPDGIECGNGQPDDAEQMNVLLYAASALLHRSYGAQDLLAALVAKCLARLHCCTASVAEHVFSPSRAPALIRLSCVTTATKYRLTHDTCPRRQSSLKAAHVLDRPGLIVQVDRGWIDHLSIISGSII
jgi:hypothetical protein